MRSLFLLKKKPGGKVTIPCSLKRSYMQGLCKLILFLKDLTVWVVNFPNNFSIFLKRPVENNKKITDMLSRESFWIQDIFQGRRICVRRVWTYIEPLQYYVLHFEIFCTAMYIKHCLWRYARQESCNIFVYSTEHFSSNILAGS